MKDLLPIVIVAAAVLLGLVVAVGVVAVLFVA